MTAETSSVQFCIFGAKRIWYQAFSFQYGNKLHMGVNPKKLYSCCIFVSILHFHAMPVIHLALIVSLRGNMKHVLTNLFERMYYLLVLGQLQMESNHIFYNFRPMIMFFSMMLPLQSTAKILVVATMREETMDLVLGWVL